MNRTEQNRTEQNRTEQNRTEQNRTEQNRTEQNRTEQNRTEQNRTEQNRTEQNRTEQNRTEPEQNIKYIFNRIRQFGIKKSFKKMMNRFIASRRVHNCEYGEDIILLPYCSDDRGFYVDIGAFHPKRHSVTRMFYEKGWRGINVEPNPHSMRAFNRIRRRDINLNIGVSDETGELNYYYWGKTNTSNTFDTGFYEELSKTRGAMGLEARIMKIKVDTLNNILAANLPKGMEIDFLTIDVEGYEFKILQSLDYGKYSPKLILVEDLSFYDKNKDFMGFRDTELYKFLNKKGYIVVAKTWYTILFKKAE